MRPLDKFLMVALAMVMLSGCQILFTGGADDLGSYVSEVLQRPGKGVKPIPEFKQTQVYIYQSGSASAKDPFALFFDKEALDRIGIEQALSPEWEQEIVHRNRQDLEEYELDTLRMAGSLEFGGTLWGLVVDPDSVIHKVKAGDYAGRNVGKVVRITADAIELRELVQDSRGRWDERTAALRLPEE